MQKLFVQAKFINQHVYRFIDLPCTHPEHCPIIGSGIIFDDLHQGEVQQAPNHVVKLFSVRTHPGHCKV